MSSNQKSTVFTEWITSASNSLVSAREKAIYEMGKEKGADQEKEKAQKLFDENFRKSYADTSKVIDHLFAKKAEVKSARLKIESVKSLKVMLSIPEEVATPELMESLYNFIYEVEESSNTSTYNVDFYILKANESFSDKSVEGDGYIYKHRLAIDEERTRRA